MISLVHDINRNKQLKYRAAESGNGMEKVFLCGHLRLPRKPFFEKRYAESLQNVVRRLGSWNVLMEMPEKLLTAIYDGIKKLSGNATGKNFLSFFNLRLYHDSFSFPHGRNGPMEDIF